MTDILYTSVDHLPPRLNCQGYAERHQSNVCCVISAEMVPELRDGSTGSLLMFGMEDDFNFQLFAQWSLVRKYYVG